MKKAELKIAKNIKLYEKLGKGNKTAENKLKLLELKKRIAETYG